MSYLKFLNMFIIVLLNSLSCDFSLSCSHKGALTMGLAILIGDRLSSCIAYVTPARHGHLKLV